MGQPSEGRSIDEEMMKLFFDFDGASSGTSRISMTGLDSTFGQEIRHGPVSTDPATSLPSSSTVLECSVKINEGSEGLNPTYSTSLAPIPVAAPGNRHCQDKNQVLHCEPGLAQLPAQMQNEVDPPYEFVALYEMDLLQTDISPNSIGAFEGRIHASQTDVSLNPLPFDNHIMDAHIPVSANQSVMNVATNAASRPFETERPKDVTSAQRKRKRAPLPGEFLIRDLLGCSPWPGQRRTQQEQRERDDVIKAGGSCLLCTFRHKKCSGKRPCESCSLFWGKRSLQTTSPQWTCNVYDKFSDLEFLNFHFDKAATRQNVNSCISQHQSMTGKISEFIKFLDPIRGIGYEIVRAYLPEKLTTLFLAFFLPLRASQCKDALAYFDPDLERFLADAKQIFGPLFREILKQCDNLFAATHRDVAVGLLGVLHHELDCINALQDVTSNEMKHLKDMVVSRLKILCPLLLDIGEHHRFGRSTMKISSAAIIRLDEELAALLSQADLMIVGQIVQLWHDWQQDSLHQKLKSSINRKTYPCLGTRASSVRLSNGTEPPLQTACYCRYVWETIEGDISNFFQITTESLSSLLHQNIEAIVPIMRKDSKEIKFEKLGEILGGVFGQIEKENDTHYLPYKVTIFLRAIKFVPEFVFQILPMLYRREKVSLDETARDRQASTYRHLVLLSLLVQACTLVDEFLREEAVNPSRGCFRPFESFLFTRREADVLDTFHEALIILNSTHQHVLEREAGMDLPEPHTH